MGQMQVGRRWALKWACEATEQQLPAREIPVWRSTSIDKKLKAGEGGKEDGREEGWTERSKGAEQR